MSEGSEMLLVEAQKYLEIVRERGKTKSELEKVYENIRRRKELFLMAYAIVGSAMRKSITEYTMV